MLMLISEFRFILSILLLESTLSSSIGLTKFSLLSFIDCEFLRLCPIGSLLTNAMMSSSFASSCYKRMLLSLCTSEEPYPSMPVSIASLGSGSVTIEIEISSVSS